VRAALLQKVDLLLPQVDAVNAISGFCECNRYGQADVAQTDDADEGLAVLDAAA
jgi:hypothetical protein